MDRDGTWLNSIAFPKNANAADLMTGAPVEVDPAQLELLRLSVVREEAKA